MGKVLNKHIDGVPAEAAYIGRGSPFGNPFVLGPEASREQVCDDFEAYLRKDEQFQERIRTEVGDRDVVCFCKQQKASVRCHGDIVVGVSTMSEAALTDWREGKLSLARFDANRELVSDYVARQGLSAHKPEPTARFLPGADISRLQADLIVSTVNCVGVMGAGVALATKKRFPEHYTPYRTDCARRLIRPGDVRVYRANNGQAIACMATKDHWKDPSRMEWVEAGLVNLARVARQRDAWTIALPPPGCGNGGLSWENVQPLVLHHMRDFALVITGPAASAAARGAPEEAVREQPSRQSALMNALRAARVSGGGVTALAWFVKLIEKVAWQAQR